MKTLPQDSFYFREIITQRFKFFFSFFLSGGFSIDLYNADETLKANVVPEDTGAENKYVRQITFKLYL